MNDNVTLVRVERLYGVSTEKAAEQLGFDLEVALQESVSVDDVQIMSGGCPYTVWAGVLTARGEHADGECIMNREEWRMR